MKISRCFNLSIFLSVGLLMVGCASQRVQTAVDRSHMKEIVKSGLYKQKVDNFMVILDSSNSMEDPYAGKKKLELAKTVVSRLNKTVPDLKLKAGLRTFGENFFPFAGKTTLRYGITDYSEESMESALGRVKWANGASPLGEALDAATDDLGSVPGDIAAIIVTDGEQLNDTPALAAGRMKDKFGDRLCIYSILVGKNTDGEKVLQNLSQKVGCGFLVNAEDVTSDKEMAGFVEKVFFEKAIDSDGDGVLDDTDKCPDTPKGVSVDSSGCPYDSDNDGVYDYLDKCPDTPQGVAVKPDGCPPDSDGDGVFDYMDECPNTIQGARVDDKGCSYDSDGDGVIDDTDKCPDTPKGISVDSSGCPYDSDNDGVYDSFDKCPNTPKGVAVKADGCSPDTDGDGIADYLDGCPGTPKGAKVNDRGCWVLELVRFDTGKATIKTETYKALDEVVSVLKSNPSLKVEIEGHTDNVGSRRLNLKLSEDRARSVMEYLTRKGIDPDRLSSAGYGFARPIASNGTSDGRAKNRRVELTPVP